MHGKNPRRQIALIDPLAQKNPGRGENNATNLRMHRLVQMSEQQLEVTERAYRGQGRLLAVQFDRPNVETCFPRPVRQAAALAVRDPLR
jgi:hypothetical protein